MGPSGQTLPPGMGLSGQTPPSGMGPSGQTPTPGMGPSGMTPPSGISGASGSPGSVTPSGSGRASGGPTAMTPVPGAGGPPGTTSQPRPPANISAVQICFDQFPMVIDFAASLEESVECAGKVVPRLDSNLNSVTEPVVFLPDIGLVFSGASCG
ncbi:hypothetical protein BaRGS_00013995 [Batillaria attramentaria]|uniref:Uncharacterized protein n=1 Tax=Batillaria attramentaria TaxID=370345 RepID=A0ABD0L6G9_9CAEN